MGLSLSVSLPAHGGECIPSPEGCCLTSVELQGRSRAPADQDELDQLMELQMKGIGPTYICHVLIFSLLALLF